jgi:hypothetical protein
MISATTWPLRDAAQAAGMKPSVLRQLFETGVLKYRGDDRHSTGSGVKVGLSRNRAIEAAIVQLLKSHGVTVSRAARAAFEFTINGNAELFPLGKTILILGPNVQVVRNIDHTASIFDFSDADVALWVDLNAIVARVDNILNNAQ